MKTNTANSAFEKLNQLVCDAHQGKEVIITGENGRSVKLVPVLMKPLIPHQPGSARSKVLMTEDFDEPPDELSPSNEVRKTSIRDLTAQLQGIEGLTDASLTRALQVASKEFANIVDTFQANGVTASDMPKFGDQVLEQILIAILAAEHSRAARQQATQEAPQDLSIHDAIVRDNQLFDYICNSENDARHELHKIDKLRTQNTPNLSNDELDRQAITIQLIQIELSEQQDLLTEHIQTVQISAQRHADELLYAQTLCCYLRTLADLREQLVTLTGQENSNLRDLVNVQLQTITGTTKRRHEEIKDLPISELDGGVEDLIKRRAISESPEVFFAENRDVLDHTLTFLNNVRRLTYVELEPSTADQERAAKDCHTAEAAEQEERRLQREADLRAPDESSLDIALPTNKEALVIRTRAILENAAAEIDRTQARLLAEQESADSRFIAQQRVIFEELEKLAARIELIDPYDFDQLAYLSERLEALMRLPGISLRDL